MARKPSAASKTTPVRRRLNPWHYIPLVVGLVGIAAGAVALTARSIDQRKPATATEIKELLVATTQRANLSSAVVTSMLDQIKTTPGADKVNPKVVEIIPTEVDAFFAAAMTQPGGLGDALVPVFAQRFTSGEIAELLAFYRSPLGRKLAKEMPLIASQSAPLAQQWTLDHWPELSQRVEAALQRQGITLPQRASTPPPATTSLPEAARR